MSYIRATGVAGAPPGTIAVSAIKTYTTTTTNTVLDNWAGLFWLSGGGTDFQTTAPPHTPLVVTVTVNGTAPTDVVAIMTQPVCDLPVHDTPLYKLTNPHATLTKIGNVLSNDSMWWGPANDMWPATGIPNALKGLDAMRKLARLDLQVHYPSAGVKDICTM